MAERVIRIKELDGGRFMSAEIGDKKGRTIIVTTSDNLPFQVEARMKKGDLCNFHDDMGIETILEFAGGIGKIREERRKSGIRFRSEYSV